MPPYGPQQPYSRKGSGVVSGAGAYRWEIKEWVEDVLSKLWEDASTINCAPGAMRRILAKRLKFEGPDNIG